MLPSTLNFQLLQQPRSHWIPTTTQEHNQQVTDTRPIPSPNNAQLEHLARLTSRANHRARECRKIDQEISRITSNKEATMTANPYFHYTHNNVLAAMDRELVSLCRELRDMKKKEKKEAMMEQEIWNQIG
ncbi:uncharacterized protein N7518_002924 [Penicillium psychrosexuale]|uniref:uncharacterized protein n=1 Tax=Penicillium psychrosexuale TaxID=1002107 RepID=UPI0025455D86|nr:uncharacterized protein N7518_002924 [Penicillium psychrosexuale]KAJ5800856.1 hypothetical protein N7518_002924 [Penicillium psychrosexuale]